MLLEKINAMWPITIRPIIDGVNIIYHSEEETFEYNQRTYSAKLGKRTYKPILGYLIISQIDLERMNYKRAQSNLEIFKTVNDAVEHILETNSGLRLLIFIAHSLVMDDGSLIYEKELLRNLGYAVVSEFTPVSLEEANDFLELYSLSQTQEERSRLLCSSKQIAFSKLEIAGFGDGMIFCNQNLAVTPNIISSKHTANYRGEIITHYEFEPVTILSQTFTRFSKPYGKLTRLTLVDNQLYDLSDKKAEQLMTCPSCKSALINNVCKNKNCREKVIERAFFIASKEGLNIRGLSRSTLGLIYDYLVNQIKVPQDRMIDIFFFYVSEEDINNIIPKAPQAELLYNSIREGASKQKLSSIINAIRIEGLDKMGAKAISKLYDNDIDSLIYHIKTGYPDEFEFMSEFKEKLEILMHMRSFIQKVV